MALFGFSSFVIIASFLFAKLEIAIEGADGWAKNLPTWRLPREHWMSKVFFGGRPATGYHVWANLFILFIMHTGYLIAPVTLGAECRILSAFIFIFTLEDFFWFALNPAFGLKNFKKDKIWWYAETWWGVVPSSYITGIPIAGLLYYLSTVPGL